MFDYISGKIAAVSENRIVVDCGGVGFSLVATASACSEFGRTQEAKIPVYLAVREDALELYGFSSVRERELVLHLTNCSTLESRP